MADTASISTITLSDFRSWLQGVEDMQDEDWVPSATQWKKIREKINQIEEQIAYQQAVPPSPRHMPENYPRPVPPPSTLYNEAGVRMTTFIPPAPAAESPKTPDIDTSNGQYKSSFM